MQLLLLDENFIAIIYVTRTVFIMDNKIRVYFRHGIMYKNNNKRKNNTAHYVNGI